MFFYMLLSMLILFTFIVYYIYTVIYCAIYIWVTEKSADLTIYYGI